MSDTELLRCSFCGRSQDECRHLITGSAGTAICDRCVLACVEILMDVNDTECNRDTAPVQGEDKE